MNGVLPQRVRSIWSNLFNKHLLLTNVGVSVGLSCLGDAALQHYEALRSSSGGGSDKGQPADQRLDLGRTLHMGAAFGLTSGFICHFWYVRLDKRFPGRTLGVVVRKVVYDQIFFSPVLIAICLTLSGLLDGNGDKVDKLLADVRNKGLKLYLAEWFLWPPAQIINFCFLPTKYRVVYDNTISIVYDIYTSHVKHNDED